MSTISNPPANQPNSQTSANASPNPQSSAWSRGPPSAAQSKPSSAIHTPVNPSGTPQPQAEGSSQPQQQQFSSNGNGVGASSGPVAIGGHSRKGSIMVGGGGVDIKQGNLAFGTVDSPNPMLSSSPAVPGLVGTHLSADKVKSFGSIEADADADPNAIKPVRRTSGNIGANGPTKLDAHALFTGKPKPNGAAPSAAPASVPGQQPGVPPTHDRRQSMSGFQNGLPPSHLRPPQQGAMPGQPRSPVLPHVVPGQYNPAQQQGFRPPQQQMMGQPGFRPNAGAPQMPQGMPRGAMGMGAYGMHAGPQQGYPPNMGYPQQGYYDYNMYNPQYGVPQQWAPQQHPQNQQYNLPVSPRPGPASASPSPAPAPLPSSGGQSPAPTPPSRPPSFTGHQPAPSNASIASIAPSTPSRPMMPTTQSFTPPVQAQSPFGAHLSGSAASFTPRKSAAIKLSRPDGTALDLKDVAAAAKGPATPASTGSGTVTPEPPKEVVKEEPKKKVPTLPVIVRLETAEQRAARLEEEAQKKKIQEIEEKEEKERQERKARQAKEAAEKEEKERQEKEAAAKEKEAAEERRKMEEAFAAEEEAEKKAAEEREAVAKAARDAEEKEKAEKLAQAAQEAREKADEKTRALVTPIASTPASPVAASPAPAAAGLPPKPVAAAAATPAGIPRRPVPSALEISPATPSMPTLDTPAPASALSTARPIEDLSAITYPAEVKGPQAELNAGAEAGKYRYDRNFLMQFMDRCKDKPDSLPPLEEIGLEAESSSGFGNRSSGRGGSRSSMGGSSRGASTGLGIGGIGNRPAFPGNSMGSFGMGSFGSGTLRGSTSEERYNRSLGSRQSSMARTPSQGGAHGLPSMSLSTSRSGTNRSRGGVKRAPQQSTQLDPDMAPLTVSATSWVKSRPTGNDEGSPEYIERKIKSLLNKLTAEKFDSISAQILDWANKSTAETDGMTLKLVIKQIFEKATDEAHWSSMYARLCRFLLDRLDPAITETFDGKPVSGGMLFRKYLVGRCQLDFESGWKAREDAATAAAAKSEEDKERLAAQGKEGESGSGGEPAILSDEYYAAQKAKRRGLGLVQLIGELYKLSMIGKGVIRTCFIRLLSNVESPDEEDMESSCKLLTTVGAQFDQESKDNMDIVFERLNTVANSDGVSSRVKFMIMDIQDLRSAKWKSKKTETQILTIAEVHQLAAKEQAEKAAAASQSSRESISRGGSRAGGRRDAQPGEWQSVAPTARPTPRADFSNLGRGMASSGSAGPQFGPNSVFNKKKTGGAITPPTLSRQASTTNMFSALGDETGAAPADRRTSADAGEGNAGPQRKKLNLKPRSVPMPGDEENAGDEDKEDEEDDEEEEEEQEETAAAAPTAMSADKAKTKIDSDMKELWGEKDAGGSRNPDDVVEYFKALPQEHKPLLVTRLVEDIFRLSKYKDAEVVAKGWKQALEEDAVSKAMLVDALAARMPTLDDDSIDFPQAYKAIALLMRSIALSEEETDGLIEKIEVLGNPKLTPRDQINRAFKALDEEAK